MLKDQHLSHFTHNNKKKIGLNLRSNFTLICYMLPNQLKSHDPLNEGSGNRKQIFLKSCHNITTLKLAFLFSIQDSLNSNRLWEAFHNLALSSLIH